MTDDELAEAISAIRAADAEMTDVEAKRAEASLPRDVRHTLSSFSNTPGGGVLILGLDEASGFTATGVNNPGQMSSALADACQSEMSPPVRATIRIHEFEGVHLAVAEIPEISATDKPCFYLPAGMNKGSYIRVGDSDFRLSPHEVQMMVASRGQPREDEEPVEEATLEDLDPDAISALLERVRRERPAVLANLPTADALRRLRVLAPAVETETPTLAGLLAVGKRPQDFYPQLNVTFVHYPTEDGADPRSGQRFVDNRSFEGAIPEMVRQVMETIRRNMSRRSVVRSVGRRDAWEYPEEALREAIVNAVVHRDLSPHSHGTQVQIEMYPNRLVIRNPGGLFGPVTLSRLGEEGVSSARNATLLRILESVEVPGEGGSVCENRGSGIKVMLQALREARMGLPEFTDRISWFEVSFPNHTLISEEVVAWLESLEQRDLTDNQCVALSLLRTDAVLTNSTYRSQTRVDSRVATAELQDLVRRGLVVQSGERRWATYRLSESAVPSRGVGRRAEARDRRDEILRALGAETLSRNELEARTGMHPRTLRGWLRRLRDEGRVRMIGATQSNKSRYQATAPYVSGGQQMALEFDDPEAER